MVIFQSKRADPRGLISFELTPAVLALRVCKPEGGRRVVTCLGATEIKWPKVLSGGPEILDFIGGLVIAQPESSLSEDILVKPKPFNGLPTGQTKWVRGESLRGSMRGYSVSPVTRTAPESKASLHVALVKLGFLGERVSNRRFRDET